MNSLKVPLKRTLFAIIVALAQDAESTTIVGKAPIDGTVTKVEYIPAATITGVDTDTRKVALVNKGTGGIGTTEIASIQFDDDVDATAFVVKALDLSETAADLDVVAGEVLTVESTAPGAGLVDPGGVVIVEITRS